MPRDTRHVDDDPPLYFHMVSPFASVCAAALARVEGRHEVGLPSLADDDVPGAQLVVEILIAIIEGDPGAAEVKQHLVDLMIGIFGISVVFIISGMKVCEPSIVWGEEHRLPDWTPIRLDFRSASEIDLRRLLLLH
jgi:hypothetical protein